MIDMPVSPVMSAHDFRQFDIHLLQGLLHVPEHDRRRSAPASVAVASRHAAPARCPEAETMRARDRRECNRWIHCASRTSVLGRAPQAGELPWFHEVDLEALRFQEFEERNPVDPGRFHSDRFHTALLQPRDDLVKIGGIGAELPDWFGVTIGGDADHMHVGMNIDSGRVRVDEFERRGRGGDGDGERPCMRVVGLGPASCVASSALGLGLTMDVSCSRMGVE